MADASQSPLPPLYARWIAELLGASVPNEPLSTCDDCAMCNHVSEGASSFSPDTKCCTYMPTLVNFLVGGILADESEDPAATFGRATVLERVTSGTAATTLGLGVPPSYNILYSNAGRSFFGRSKSMLCPHYVEPGGLCGVWRHRNSVCATWFCKHVRGEVGWNFWEAVRELLGTIEQELARWCMLELGISAAVIDQTLPTDAVRPGESRTTGGTTFDGRVSRAAHLRNWGSWAGREKEYYLACAKLVDALDFEGVLRVSGAAVALRAKVLRAAWDRLNVSDAPERLKVPELVVLRTTKSKVRLNTYSGFDPVEIPRRLFDALHAFDGRPNAEALSAIVDDGGPRISASLVRKLADFRVLVPSSPSEDGDDAT